MKQLVLVAAVAALLSACGESQAGGEVDAGRISEGAGCDLENDPGHDLPNSLFEYDYACTGAVTPVATDPGAEPPVEDCSEGIWPDLNAATQVCPTFTSGSGPELPVGDERVAPVEMPVSESGSFLVDPPASFPTRLKVVAWNMKFTSQIDLQIDALANHPSLADADVWLLSEVDRCSQRNGARRAARDLAREIGGDYVYGIEFVELHESVGGDTGQAIVSRRPISGAALTCHSSQEDWYADEGEPRLGSRVTLHADIPVGNQVARLYAAHFESRDVFGDKRIEQVREFLDASQAKACERPQIIAGDFNTWYCTAPELEVLRRSGFEDVLMTAGDVESTSANGLRLDYMWTRGFRVIDGGVVRDLELSDHEVLWAVLELSE